MKRTEFSELALSYLDEVTAFAYHLTDEEWEAEDLVQSTYEKAFEGCGGFEDPAKCRAWLFRIARNHWYDRLRAREAGPKLELVDPKDPASPSATVPPSEQESSIGGIGPAHLDASSGSKGCAMSLIEAVILSLLIQSHPTRRPKLIDLTAEVDGKVQQGSTEAISRHSS
jgi:RNA polymerase sigma factor (sigma-70 family)